MALGEPLSDSMSNLSILFEADNNSCSLSRLPTNVRWKIFGFLTESTGEMKLVSKSWLSMVNEWAIPENLPELIAIDICEKNSRTMHVTIEFRKSEGSCFGRLRDLVEEINYGAEEECCSDFPHCSGIAVDLSYYSDDIGRLASVIRTKTKNLRITRNEKKYRGPSFFNAVLSLLSNLEWTTYLNFSQPIINKQSDIFLRQLISKLSVQKISVSGESQYDARELLTEMSKQIKTIVITLHKRIENQLYSWTDIEHWINFTLVMFYTGHLYHNGVTSIELNPHNDNVFTSFHFQLLVEFLISSGKPFHFRTILLKEPKSMTVNGFDMKIASSGNIWIVDLCTLSP